MRAPIHRVPRPVRSPRTAQPARPPRTAQGDRKGSPLPYTDASRGAPSYGRGKGQYISLKPKRGKNKTRKLHIWHTTRKQKEKNKELSMYRLREMDIDDKVCEQVSMTMLSEVYPTDVIERCVQQSEPWSTKVRREWVGP